MASDSASFVDDIFTAVDCLAPLRRCSDDDPRWQLLASPTSWSAARAVDHVADALTFYAGQIARRADRQLPVLRDGHTTATPSERLDNVVTAASLLSIAIRDLGPGRAWHPSGNADAAGWTAMAVTELLVHGTDAGHAIDVVLDLPENVCRRTVHRVFPWIEISTEPPSQVLLAITGRSQVPGVPSDPDWWWQSSPLGQWDGRPRRRDRRPNWQ